MAAEDVKIAVKEEKSGKSGYPVQIYKILSRQKAQKTQNN